MIYANNFLFEIDLCFGEFKNGGTLQIFFFYLVKLELGMNS